QEQDLAGQRDSSSQNSWMAQNTSPAQADAFALAKAKEKGSAWLVRNDKLRGWRRATSGFFFDEGFAVGGFVSRDHFLRQFVRHVVVMGKFHRVAGAALRHGC